MKQQASAVPVKFCDYKDSVMRVAGILWVPTMRSRDTLLQAKGDHLGLRSDGSQMIRRGEVGLVEPELSRVQDLKTRVKGTVQLPL